MTSDEASQWQWVADTASLASVVERLKSAKWVAVDTEFRRRDTFYPQVALVQLATPEGCWLVDPLALTDPYPLVELLSCKSLTKVLHSASEDLEVFEHWLGCLPTPLFDTQKAAAMIHRGFGLSYRALVAIYLDIELDKEETQSDWLARPLSPAQLTYAAMDVVHLAQLYPTLQREVAERGRESWVLEEGARAETGGRGPLAKFKSAWKLSAAQQTALIKLVEWREQQARKRDKPRSWILADKAISALVQRKPTSVRELGMIEGVSQGLARRAGDTLVELVNGEVDPRLNSDSLAVSRPAAGHIKALAKQLTGSLETLAVSLEMNAEIVFPTRELELIARKAAGEVCEEPRHWRGWRYDNFVLPLLRRAQALLENKHEVG